MNRRRFLQLLAAGGAGSVAAVRAYGAGLNPSDIERVKTPVRLPSIPAAFDGFKIALLADLHYGAPGVTAPLIERAVEMAMEPKPDIICFCGDLMTGSHGGMREALAIAGHAAAPMGVYAVLGNHEFRWNALEATKLFERSSIRLLRNETVDLRRGNAVLRLTGLDNLFNQPLNPLKKLLEDIEEQPASIVLEHTPDIAPLFSPKFDGLLLCGHTHGGQIILPVLGQMMTASRFGLKYVAGLYPVGDGQMYITRGVGGVLVPCRIGCPPEVSLIELVAKSEMQTRATFETSTTL